MPIGNFVEADTTGIDEETVWKTKFARAPGAFDLKRRLEVMDFTGVRRQMLFPGSVGLYAVSFYYRADAYPDMLKSIQGDRRGYALQLIAAYNDFCIRTAQLSDRLRPVGIALAPTVEDLYLEVKRMIGRWHPGGLVAECVVAGGSLPGPPRPRPGMGPDGRQ